MSWDVSAVKPSEIEGNLPSYFLIELILLFFQGFYEYKIMLVIFVNKNIQETLFYQQIPEHIPH